MLKIAMLCVHSSPVGKLGSMHGGGMSVCVSELAKELGKLGNKVDIYTRMINCNQAETSELFENVRLIQLNSGPADTMDNAAYAYLDTFCMELERYRLRHQLKYDLIHSHYWLSGWAGKQTQTYWQTPHVMMFHTLGMMKNMTSQTPQEPLLRISVEKLVANTCHRIVAFTEKERKYLADYYNVPNEKIGVVPCGVNLDRFTPQDRKTARKQFGFKENESILLYVGRFVPLKGLRRLLEVMTHLPEDRNFRLVIIGGNGLDSAYTRRLIQMSLDQGIDNRVSFIGSVDQKELSGYYSAADFLTLPSRYESFGLVALEAMACGTPVIATQVGVMEQIIKEGKTGHLITDGSPVKIAQDIHSFVNNFVRPAPSTIRNTITKLNWANTARLVLNEYRALYTQYRRPVKMNTTGKPVASIPP